MRVDLSSFIPDKKTRLGMAAGFLAAITSIPILSKSDNSLSAAPPNKKTSSSLIKEDDYAFIQALRTGKQNNDKYLQEKEWAEKVYPTIRKKLISLYQAEREDIKLLKEGKITEKERRVKLCYTDFVRGDETAEDDGTSLNLHVVKYFDERQEDGSYLRTYVNEHWPVNEYNNGILLPEVIRVRAQTFKGAKGGLESLKLTDADNLFTTDFIHIIWGVLSDGSKGNAGIYPFLYRQHLYGDFDKAKKENSVNQVEANISNPTSCMNCHHSKSSSTNRIFLNANEKRINFGAITPDKEFEKPYSEQRGYIKYIDYLKEKLKQKKCTEKFITAVAKDLLNLSNMENPYIIEALKENNSLPWVEGDYKYERYDHKAKSYTYTTKEIREIDGVKKEIETRMKKAGFDLYLDQLLGIGEWWDRDNLQVIPRYSSLK